MHTTMALVDMRKGYGLAGRAEKDLAGDPFRQLEQWLRQAGETKMPEPNAMVPSIIGHDSRPGRPAALFKAMDA